MRDFVYFLIKWDGRRGRKGKEKKKEREKINARYLIYRWKTKEGQSP